MEEKIYKLGNYEFDTLREYEQAQEDLQKIKYITDELDIYDPEVALRLYNLMRTKQIKFKSEIGKSFFWCISDIVADSSKDMIEEKKKGTEPDEAIKPLVKITWQKIAGIACIIIAVICMGYYGLLELHDYYSAKKLEELQSGGSPTTNMGRYVETEEPVVTASQVSEQQNETEETEVTPPPVLEEYASLKEQNPDTVGWLKIEGTVIDYPVVQPSADEEYDYYLRHAFDKSEDKNGTLFVDARNNIINRDDNLIIYGHNMKSGMMFGGLQSYLDENFRAQHPTIQFDTIYEKATYQIIGVCLAKVEYQDETVFRYYNFLNADNEAEFEDYKERMRQMEVTGASINASYGDKLLTLSTCNYYIEDGRMFIVAKKI